VDGYESSRSFGNARNLARAASTANYANLRTAFHSRHFLERTSFLLRHDEAFPRLTEYHECYFDSQILFYWLILP
jgi:hypothetical protein